ncbi:MAG: family 16 glycosylhydrolase [Oligoflexales bacterium]|nr:family 16 glycosylhydrolase [Oligoflexales bacterium]
MKFKGIASSFFPITMILGLSFLSKAHAAQIYWDWWEPFENNDNWVISSNWSNNGTFGCTWNAANARNIDGSAMQLSVSTSNEKSYCGEMRTKDRFGYGYYEINMKVQRKPGIVTGFFAYTGPSYGTSWDEIDIEILGDRYVDGKPVVQFTYYHDGVKGYEKIYGLPFDPSAEYHKYGFLWAADSIAWYIDGREVYRTYGDVPDKPTFIILNHWNFIGGGEWAGGYWNYKPNYAWFDYVKFNVQ